MEPLMWRLGVDRLCEAATLAGRRNLAKQAPGITNKRVDGSRDDYEVHLLGLYGELAVEECLPGAVMDRNIYPHGDGCVGDIDYRGYKWQVKCRTYSGAGIHLYFNFKEEFRADGAILGSMKVPGTVLLWGWIWRDDFLARCEEVDYGYGPRYRVGLDALRPMAELLKLEAKHEPAR